MLTSLPFTLPSLAFFLERGEAWIVLVFLLFWVGVPLYCLWRGLKHNRIVLWARCLPTSKARAVFIGLSEVKGEAVQEREMTSYLAETECVWYSYTIEEEWERYETKTYRDSNGNTRTRTERRSGWTTVENGTSAEAFLVQDDTGSVRVLPEGAKVDPELFLKRTCGPSNPLYYGKGPECAIDHSTYRRRFTEYGIPAGSTLYVLGTTRERQDSVHPEFAAAKNNDPYIISTKKEEQVVRRSCFYAVLLPALGVLLYLLPVLGIYDRYDGPIDLLNAIFHRFNPRFYWAYSAMAYVALWMICRMWQGYNGMVGVHHRVLQGEAQVEVQLQRRYDLISQLVNVVEAYCRHEQELLERLGEMREMVSQGRLIALAEAYPGLKANTLFARLQQELSDTEERLALAREYLNTIGNFYNTRLRMFPTGLLFRLFGFRTYRPKE